jgi:hypothetical protein
LAGNIYREGVILVGHESLHFYKELFGSKWVKVIPGSEKNMCVKGE